MITLKVFNYQTGEFQEAVLNPEQGDCLIGRNASCDLVLESFDVSRIHAKIQAEKNDYYFVDPGSANGSCINGQTVETNQTYPLKLDDLIRIGDFVLLVEAIDFSATEHESTNETLGIIKRLESRSVPEKAPGSDWTEDVKVRCVRVTPETSDVKTFTFVADPPRQFHYKPGQFVTLDLEINGESVLRSYSISSTPSRPYSLDITVKRVASPVDAPDLPPGLVSNWLHDAIAVGDQIKISAPMGKFTCAPNIPAKLLMISAGSGITPMMSMMRWIADMALETDVVFFHCARSPRDIIFRQELEMMSARLPNFHLVISTTQAVSPNSAELGQAWSGLTGRLTEAMLRCIAPDFQDRNVYVCGPNGFMGATKSLLEALNFPMQNYAEESFGAPRKTHSKKPQPEKSQPEKASANPVLPASSSSESIVLFSKSDKQVAHDGSESILELAEQEDIKIRSNCRQGVCGACKKRKLEGEVKYESEPDVLDADDRAAGYILTCVASPVGRVAIEA
jgi:glycine betaine catabolism B